MISLMAKRIWTKDKFHNVGFNVDKNLTLWLSDTNKALEKSVRWRAAIIWFLYLISIG